MGKNRHHMDTSLDTSHIPRISFKKVNQPSPTLLQVSINPTKLKEEKTNPALLNTKLFPESLEKAKTDNIYLKKYLETKISKYLFEAINDDYSLISDPIVIESISNWRELIDPRFSLIASSFCYMDDQDIKDCEYVLKRIGESLIPPKHDTHYIVSCIGNSGLVHKIPLGTRGRPSLKLDPLGTGARTYSELDNRKIDKLHPFVVFWNCIKQSIEQNRPQNERGQKKIYRGESPISDKVKDYKKTISKLLGKEISEKELKYFEWTDIKTIVASTIAFILKNNCQLCSRNDTRNNWHTIFRIYNRAKKLKLFNQL